METASPGSRWFMDGQIQQTTITQHTAKGYQAPQQTHLPPPAHSLSLSHTSVTSYTPSIRYRIDSGDKLNIKVFGETALSGQYSVDGDGNIALPLISMVYVRGLTTSQARDQIVLQLRNGYLRNPSVNVEIATFRPFYILGEVKNAGQYPFVNGMNVQTAIAIAGGYSARANQKKFTITRHLPEGVAQLKVLPTDIVMPGDTIHVKERFF